MKKLITLFLVLCLSFGLIACGKQAANKTDSTAATNPAAGGDVVIPGGTNIGVSGAKPFKGKSLEIYGLGTGEEYTDYSQFGKGNYVWMMRAALEEWATMNEVTIQFLGTYNQNQVLANMSSGGHPDIIFQTAHFPAMANVGITSAFTEAEVSKLAEICGTDSYLTMMNYKGQSHGFVYPWSGVSMLYYNKTMFEDYGVKTPKEYFAEGNWNWETFQLCLEQTTKDVDADSVNL